MSAETLWYIARGTGIVTIILLSASVALGVLTSMRWSAPQWPRFVSQGLHKNVSLLATSFLGVHILTSVVDPVSPVRILNVVFPFTGTYRPVAIGLGVIAFDLLAALVISSLAKRHIGHQTWRAIHWSAYACWPFALVHGFAAGTDSSAAWALPVYGMCVLVVLAAVIWRVGAILASPAPAPARVR